MLGILSKNLLETGDPGIKRKFLENLNDKFNVKFLWELISTQSPILLHCDYSSVFFP